MTAETAVPRRAGPSWQAAFDAQMGLWRWYRQERSAEWLAGLYAEAVKGSGENFRSTLNVMYDAEQGRILDCDPVYVSAEMCQLVDAARKDFDPEPLYETDLVTPRGFMYFEEPFIIGDRHDRPLAIRAVAWTQQFEIASDKTTEDVDRRIAEFIEASEAGEQQYGSRFAAAEMDAWVTEGILERHGVLIGLYADREDYRWSAAARHEEESPGKYDETMSEFLRITEGTPLVTVHLAPWQYGMTFAGNEVDLQGRKTGAREWWQLLQTTFRLMQQRLAHKGYERPRRAQRREFERIGGRPDTEVVIVRLRREAGEAAEPSGESANYSHRFIVGGHWRNQWYPSEQVHRQIYISPYVKGPEDKPLIVRPRRVFQWEK